MKALMITLLLAFSSAAFGFGDDITQDQRQAQGFIADIDASSRSGSRSSSSSASGASANNSISDYDSFTSVVKEEYEAVSASAASLSLAYCSDGASAQAKEGGISMGQVNFVCESVAAIKVTLLAVKMDIASAEAAEDLDIRDEYLIKANLHMEQIRDMIDGVVNYIDERANTASIGAGARDLALPIGGIWLLLFLL